MLIHIVAVDMKNPHTVIAQPRLFCTAKAHGLEGEILVELKRHAAQ
jgi:hypothetical protein